MTPINELWGAVVGWYELLSARPEAARHFNLTRRGLGIALGFYLLMVVVTLATQALMGQLAGLSDVVMSAAVNVLPLLGVALVILITIALLRLNLSFTALAVPAIYAMTFMGLVQLPLSLWTGGLFSTAILALLAYMFYRDGRQVGKMSIGVSIAFAALSIIALVALPAGLYMLLVPAAPSA
jgi:hypothetical protein